MSESAEANGRRSDGLASTDPAPLVTFLTSTLGQGGVTRVIIRLANHLDASGIRCNIYCTHSGSNLLDELSPGVQVHVGKGSTRKSVLDFASFLRRYRPATVYAFREKYVAFAALGRAISLQNTWLVGSVRTSIIAERNTSIWRRLASNLWVQSFRHIDAMIVPSKDLVAEVILHTPVQSNIVHTIPNPAVGPREANRRAREGRLPTALGDDRGPFIVALGRLVPQKDFETLLVAFSKVLDCFPHRLVIAGDGPQRTELQALAKDLGIEHRLSLIPYVDNPFPLLQSASLCVMSSRWEGFPNTILDSLSIGTPVVSTDCPTGPREILTDKSFGSLVPVGDPDSLADAIIVALKEPPSRTAAMEWSTRYTVDTVAPMYAQVGRIMGEFRD